MGKPNNLLRAARLDKGWTQPQVAEKIGRANSVTVSRWESGATFPSPYYRERLCELFALSPARLGLVPRQAEVTVSQPGKPIFLLNEPLLEPEEMYGRKREKDTLLQRIARKASTSITGPRRIGKTWLIRYLRLVAPAQLGERFRIGYIDGMSPQCQTVNGFAAEALTRLGLAIPADNPGLVSLDLGVQQLVSQKLVPVLCIDEFERFSSRPEFTLEFFEGLRAMTQTSDLVLVIASKQPLHLVVNKSAEGSSFFNIFEQLVLKPFSYSDAEKFILEKSIRAGFTSQEQEYLWKYGKELEQEKLWSPLRLQLAGKLLLDELEQARLDPQYRQHFEEQFTMSYQTIMY